MTAEIIDTELDDRLRWFVGSLNRIVATAGETNGMFGLMEQWARRGFAPPTHVHHHEDSALYLLDGVMRVRVGDDESTVTAGQFVFLPRDIPHSFRVDSADAHFLELVTPGGFEEYHIDTSDPAEVAALPPDETPDIPRLVNAIAPYDAEITGPPL